MITPEWCQLMARYNAWQNTGYRKAVEEMSMDELTRDRGAFFGSIFATLNHLLWGDMMWMSRLGGGEAPPGPGIGASTTLCGTKGEWEALRFRTDGRIRQWADGLDAVDLVGNLTWYSSVAGREMSRPIGLCVTGFFNHQTHHRGQVHAMLTATGRKMPDTDVFFMEGA